SSSNTRRCQNSPRVKASTTQMSRERAGKMNESQGTAYCVAKRCATLGQIFGANRQAPHALAVGRNAGVAYGRSDGRGARFADAAGAVGALYDVDFHFGRFVDAQHIVIVEVGLFDTAVGDGDFAL